MRAFANLTLLNKLIAAFAIVIFAASATMFVVMNRLDFIESSERLTAHTYEVMDEIDATHSALVDQQTGLRGYLLGADEKFLEPYRLGQDKYSRSLARAKLLIVDSGQQRRLDDLENAAAASQNGHAEKAIALMKQEATTGQARNMEGSGAGKILFDAIRQKAGELKTFEADLLRARQQAQSAAFRSTFIFTLLGGAFLAAFAIGSCALLTREIASPVRNMTADLKRLADGDLAVQARYEGRLDEIGAMAATIAIFRQNAERVKSLEQEERTAAAVRLAQSEAMLALVKSVGTVVESSVRGDFSARVTAETADPSLRKLVDGINQINTVVDGATTEFVAILDAVATGDLTQTISTDYKGRFSDLKLAINDTIMKLADTIATIQGTAVDVAAAAKEINSGSDDLASRTEGQASSLEQTAATTEELAASVKSSAHSSRQAVDLAQEAMGIAEAGGAIVTDAVSAMARIEQASQKISDISSVIDEIAFQTNLLALNAAVEAARAGDAGKGFAVVASEVRTLAQRSSAAAKDITGLINHSTTEVAQGVKLVRSAGDALGNIVSASRKVVSTVSEISAAATEQANGIDEMSQAVAHMDEMTQQNASLAEESAASATSLTSLIERLNELVVAFRIQPGSAKQQAARASSSEPERLRRMAQTAFSTKPKPAAERTKATAGVQRTARKTGTGGANSWSEF